MLIRLVIPALFIAVTTSLIACGKEERKSESANPERQKDNAAAAEAEKRNSVMAELSTEQQFLDLKIKAAVDRLEKQGNKTKKKLKPRFASLDAERTEVSSSLDKLKGLSDPGFTEESNILRARQDSLSKSLSGLEKSMK